MGKIIYGMLQSLDGFIANEAGEITLPVPGPELHEHFNEVMRNSKLSIYGRRMYEVMQYWGTDDEQRSPVSAAFAKAWQETPKVVVSTTLASVGPNTTLLKGDLKSGIEKLKAQYDGTIDASGAELAASLSRLGLIDEYWLYMQPVVLGEGKPYFAPGSRPALRLLGSEPLPQDVVLLRYGRA
jgi:dihydrofolate reductase